MLYPSLPSGQRRLEDDELPDVGVRIAVVSGDYAGTYEVIYAGHRDNRVAMSLLPESAWNVADPVERRSRAISLSFPNLRYLRVWDDHAPVCRTCGEYWPCSHQKEVAALHEDLGKAEQEEERRARKKAQAEKLIARYSNPGFCPACGQPIASNQPSQTFEENLIVKDGPPVTFHVSQKCAVKATHSMWSYQQKLRKHADKKSR